MPCAMPAAMGPRHPLETAWHQTAHQTSQRRLCYFGSQKLKISIDYDDTYTRDPVFWNMFCQDALDRGHEVYCVSARHPTHMDDPEFTVGRVIGASKCIGTNGVAKKDFMWNEHGIIIDVWVDDTPEAVVTGIDCGDIGAV